MPSHKITAKKFAFKVSGAEADNEFIQLNKTLHGKHYADGECQLCKLIDITEEDDDAFKQAVPIGQWVDVGGEFLTGAIITIDADGTGAVQDGQHLRHLDISPIYDDTGRVQPGTFSISVGGTSVVLYYSIHTFSTLFASTRGFCDCA